LTTLENAAPSALEALLGATSIQRVVYTKKLFSKLLEVAWKPLGLPGYRPAKDLEQSKTS
jgi:hypothetical protein